MTDDTHLRTGPTSRVGMTPLWVISLFVSLTEVVTGIAVTQASGVTQTALTMFVIAFPLLVAGAFFTILWNRPYVFYPPSEFASGVDVTKYIEAMGSSVDPIRAGLEAEVSNLRAEAELKSFAIRERFGTIEDLLAKMSRQTGESEKAFEEYRSAVGVESERQQRSRSEFERRAQYRIHVASVTEGSPTEEQHHRVEELVSTLRQFGYRTSEGWLNSLYYLNGYKGGRDWRKIRVIFADGSPELASEIIELLRDRVDVALEPVEVSEAIRNSSEMVSPSDELLPSKDLDLTVAYCMD